MLFHIYMDKEERLTLRVKLRKNYWGIIWSKWWARQDLNLRPHAYQACALTNWATGPLFRENGGGYRVRTDDILLAKQMLYQLS